MSESVLCGKCGAALIVDARFCHRCGASVVPDAEPGTASPGASAAESNSLPASPVAAVTPPPSGLGADAVESISLPPSPVAAVTPPPSGLGTDAVESISLPPSPVAAVTPPPSGLGTDAAESNSLPPTPIAAVTPPPSGPGAAKRHPAAALPAKGPGPAKIRLPVLLAIVGVVALVICIAIAALGAAVLQNQLGSAFGLPSSTPQIAVMRTSAATQSPLVPTSPPTPVLPDSPSPTATIPPSTNATTSPTLPPTATRPPAAPPTIAKRTATPSPAATVASGVYILDVRFIPSPAVRGQEITFLVNFLNTTGQPQGYQVIIYIYRPGNFGNSFGETAVTDLSIPVGTRDQQASYGWKVTGGGGCEDFVARIAWLGPDKKPTIFNRPDGHLFEKTFQVCP